MRRAAVGKRIELTPRDLELFKLLSRYRYLRSNFLYAFLGGASEKRFIERLGHLYHDGRYINRPAQQWQYANSRYMPVVYELDDAGAQALVAHGMGGTGRAFLNGRGRQSRQFAHTLMVSEVLASLELGVRAEGSLRFISADEIIAKAPDATRSADNPLAFPVSVEHALDGSRKVSRTEFMLVPDALFGLEYEGKRYRFFALEADRNTMPCVRSDLRQSSYLRKLLGYRAVATQKLYKDRLGLPNLLVLNVTTSEEHMRNVMSAVKELTSGGSTAFLFKAMSGFGSMCSVLMCPSLLTEAWQRVGFGPMSIASG
jgi:hypothetical protein